MIGKAFQSFVNTCAEQYATPLAACLTFENCLVRLESWTSSDKMRQVYTRICQFTQDASGDIAKMLWFSSANANFNMYSCLTEFAYTKLTNSDMLPTSRIAVASKSSVPKHRLEGSRLCDSEMGANWLSPVALFSCALECHASHKHCFVLYVALLHHWPISNARAKQKTVFPLLE